MSDELTVSETRRLEELEAKMRGWQDEGKAFRRRMTLNWGGALTEIRDGKLYRARFPSFEQYVEEVWGFNRSRAYQLIQGAAVAEQVNRSLPSENVHNCRHSTDRLNVGPVHEGQTRELAKAPPEKQAEVWESARRGRDPEKVTAKELAEARQAQGIPAPQKIKATTEEAQEIYQCRVMLEWAGKFSGDATEILKSITRYINTNYSSLSAGPEGHPLWKPFIRHFLGAYEERFKNRPSLAASDFRQLKGLFKRFADMDLDWWKRGVERFVLDDEEWVRGHGQPLRCFADHFNRWNPDKKTRMEQYREDIENAANRIH